MRHLLLDTLAAIIAASVEHNLLAPTRADSGETGRPDRRGRAAGYAHSPKAPAIGRTPS